MSQRDLNVSVTGVPAGTSRSAGSAMSRLWPPDGGQPKSLPERDHQTWSPEGTSDGSMIWRPGSGATYASPLWTPAPVSVYGVPSGCFQSIRLVSRLVSCQPSASTV